MVTPPRKHEWGYDETLKMKLCKICLVVKRRDGMNQPCKGRVQISLHAEEVDGVRSDS